MSLYRVNWEEEIVKKDGRIEVSHDSVRAYLG